MPDPSDTAADSIWPPGTVLAEEILEATLDLVIALVMHTLDGADGVSISLVCRYDGDLHTARATSAGVTELDGVQYESDQGPCVEATRTGKPVNIAIGSEAARWPEFTQQAQAREIRSVLAMPLLKGESVLGALNVYSQRPAFPEQDRGLVEHSPVTPPWCYRAHPSS